MVLIHPHPNGPLAAVRSCRCSSRFTDRDVLIQSDITGIQAHLLRILGLLVSMWARMVSLRSRDSRETYTKKKLEHPHVVPYLLHCGCSYFVHGDAHASLVPNIHWEILRARCIPRRQSNPLPQSDRLFAVLPSPSQQCCFQKSRVVSSVPHPRTLMPQSSTRTSPLPQIVTFGARGLGTLAQKLILRTAR